MKALPYLKLVTLTRSWAWVILEGDTEMIFLCGMYLRPQLNFHDLRTIMSYEHWFTLSYIPLCFEWT
jgi:hypothetical protein